MTRMALSQMALIMMMMDRMALMMMMMMTDECGPWLFHGNG